MTRASQKERGACHYCGSRAECSDRILPRALLVIAGYAWLNINNWRPACVRCHDLRTLAGHCPAAMMTVRMVVNPLEIPGAAASLERAVAKAWFGGRRPAKSIRPADLKLPVQRWPALDRLHALSQQRK